uniref:Eukaryotic translation initiation factor 4E family member 1B n=1 Tax=Rousettus aegyptiacus TaxID=9407 RepID=A0A7J8FFR4_ROUAE|nr:eukaryotic translation initiation factor 4E family member 1B [Rousettus aegyptiacus]
MRAPLESSLSCTFCRAGGLCGSSRMTAAGPGRTTCILSPSLTLWRTSGRCTVTSSWPVSSRLVATMPCSSCCVLLGRALRSTAGRCVGLSSTSALRGTRLRCGLGRQRTRRACSTLGVSTKSAWDCPQRPSLDTRPMQTRPPRATP